VEGMFYTANLLTGDYPEWIEINNGLSTSEYQGCQIAVDRIQQDRLWMVNTSGSALYRLEGAFTGGTWEKLGSSIDIVGIADYRFDAVSSNPMRRGHVQIMVSGGLSGIAGSPALFLSSSDGGDTWSSPSDPIQNLTNLPFEGRCTKLTHGRNNIITASFNARIIDLGDGPSRLRFLAKTSNYFSSADRHFEAGSGDWVSWEPVYHARAGLTNRLVMWRGKEIFPTDMAWETLDWGSTSSSPDVYAENTSPEFYAGLQGVGADEFGFTALGMTSAYDLYRTNTMLGGSWSLISQPLDEIYSVVHDGVNPYGFILAGKGLAYTSDAGNSWTNVTGDLEDYWTVFSAQISQIETVWE